MPVRELKEDGIGKDHQITVEQRKIDKWGTWLDDEKEKNSTPIDGEQLYEWMVAKLDKGVWPEKTEKKWVPLPPTAETPFTKQADAELPPKPDREDAPPLKVKIERLLVFQPPTAETPIGVCQADQPFMGFIQSGKPFALEVNFTLPQLVAAETLVNEATYRASFYVKRAGSRISLDQTQSQNFLPGKTFYKARLSEAILQPGVCRLGVLITIQAKFSKIVYFESPHLHVI